ncbi:hypothetical protein [Chryseobacterium sp. G0201]|uniref:hypothetical protein n=1 Tax=Chryseobacterium sp. G0201 TaxID=2487065 RepID=UPI000F4DF0A2|nr:hypothetical protein [Chryseobacterium sp. G0201]AZA54005.1 hypothetical protein EG348_13850 [Chryseobacterium sp. G0201]
MRILFLNSCGTVTNYDAPLEPGQTVFQKQGSNGTNNNQNNNIPEPGQNKMKSQSDDDGPEPGQTTMKTGDDDDEDDNVVESGQTEMK